MGQLNLVQLHHLVDSFIQKYQHLLRVSLLSVFVFVAMPSANGAERLKRIIENNELRVCIWRITMPLASIIENQISWKAST